MRHDPGNVAHRAFEHLGNAGRGSVVFQPDLEPPGHRQAAPPIHLEPLATGHAVGYEDRVPVHGPDLDGPPRELLDETDLVPGAHHVSDVHRALEGQGEPGEEVAEGLLEREADDRRDDGRSREDRAEVGVERRLQEHREHQSEHNDRDDLTQQGGRRGATAQAITDVEEEIVEQARDEQSACKPDGEETVVAGVGIHHGHAEPRQRENGAGHDHEEREGRENPPRSGEQVRHPHGHRSAIRSATARGSPASWKRRTAAIPEIRFA
jgi:hypothetical protein